MRAAFRHGLARYDNKAETVIHTLQQIDQLVCGLYDLTEEEIGIVR